MKPRQQLDTLYCLVLATASVLLASKLDALSALPFLALAVLTSLVAANIYFIGHTIRKHRVVRPNTGGSPCRAKADHRFVCVHTHDEVDTFRCERCGRRIVTQLADNANAAGFAAENPNTDA